MASTFEELQSILRSFVRERQWESFHNPKNLVMALTGEVGELAEHFQWLTPEDAIKIKDHAARKSEVAFELADILTYLLRLADVLEIDLEQATRDKIVINGQKYPVEWAKGQAAKYTKRGLVNPADEGDQ
jgi:NTP pyrophosphatase (non-canonical NTP hydrolase)